MTKLLCPLITCLLLYSSCTDAPMPQPTEVLSSMEDVEKGPDRRRWIEQMHASAPEDDWRSIELSTALRKHALRSHERTFLNKRSAEELFADGAVVGTWVEKGSTDQAGSVLAVDYDPTTDRLYTVSAGGSIWRRSRTINDWTLLNDDLEFDNKVLHVLPMASGQPTLIAAIQGIIYTSSDEGVTWTVASGLVGDSQAQIAATATIKRPDDMTSLIIIQKASRFGDYVLYHSSDGGRSFEVVQTLGGSDNRNYDLEHVRSTGQVYLIEQLDADRSRISRWDEASTALDVVTPDSPIGAGSNGRINLQAAMISDTTLRLFVYRNDNIVYYSDDLGVSWSTKGGSYSASAWEVGLFVSEASPHLMISGEVEAHISGDTGQVWGTINRWYDYYDDVEGSLHADIMWMEEFDTPAGDPFIIINNHGGMYITYNNAVTVENLSLTGLHVCQYYDVETSPRDEDFVVAGSQDQGLQRGFFFEDGVEYMEQVISGDYGHITWERNGQRMWAIYPFGLVHYYNDAQFGGVAAGYEVQSEDEGVWITPMVHDPDDRASIVYVAGGSATGGAGKYLIKLEQRNGNIVAENMPFDFAISGGDITAIEIDPGNEAIWYVATSTGKLYKSTDRGYNYSEIGSSIPNGHYLYGADIVVSKLDPKTIIICGSGYSTPGVRISKDGGDSFRSLINGLPRTMVHELAYNSDETILYAATEAGPYAYVFDDGKWYDLTGINVPAQRYWSVDYLPDSEVVRYGTYGRGIFDLRLETTPTSTTTIRPDEPVATLYPNPASAYISIDSETDYSTVDIIDSRGQRVLQLAASERIDISALPAGSYYILIEGSASLPFVKI